MSVKDKLKYILAIPKTIFFNLKMLPLAQAIYLPIFISNDTKIYGCYRGTIHLNGKISIGTVRIGFWEGAGRMGYKEPTVLCVDKDAHILLGNNIAIAKGSVIRVISGGKLNIGDNFKGNFSTQIMCRKELEFGRDCLIGWNCTFTDGDGHSLLCDGHRTNPDEAVHIGNNVWFGAHSTVLKGTTIRNGSIIAFGALCNKKYDEENILLAGNPAKIMKRGISWQI